MSDFDSDFEVAGTVSPIRKTAATAAKGKQKRKSVEGKYQKLSHYEHVLKRPDTYIGSRDKATEPMWIWDVELKEMVHKDVTYVPGLFKIFDEILVNAADNKQRDPKGCNTIKISIEPENNRISVFNNGRGIDVTEHREHSMWVPQLIFGELLTGDNYDDEAEKVTGGRNGYGAKLCNIYSKSFTVETSSEKYKKSFKMEWRNNMNFGKTMDPNKAVIKPATKKDFTKITFEPDLEKFGIPALDNDHVGIFTRRAYDIAATTGCNVYVNDEKLPVKGFKEYCELFTKNTLDNAGNPVKLYHKTVNDHWDIAIAVSDVGYRQISFCNSIATTKGGKHVDYIRCMFSKEISAAINKKRKGNGAKATDTFIKNHMFVFVNALVVNPSFDSQTKENMTLPANKYKTKAVIPDAFLKDIVKKSGIVEAATSFADFKDKKKLEGKKGAKTNKINVPKLDDANNAGTKNGLGCTLILTEGDSAKSTAVCGLGVIGRDNYGVFPLRGKVLNVRDATSAQITGNAEISNLVKILALDYKQKYEDADDLKRLRYGKVMIMTDQDHDGSHIKGLLINFFHSKWPNLLKHKFLEQFITPIVKVTKGANCLSFYSMPEFEEWQNTNPDSSKWSTKYYKGLGTSSAKEAKEYFSNIARHRIKFKHSMTDECDKAIEMAFSKSQVDGRKSWLTSFMQEKKERIENNEPEDYLYGPNTKQMNYKQFVDKELVLFSYADLERSVPGIMDGLKPGQRKVLYTFFNKYKHKGEVKVAQASGGISEYACYHHGEVSLQGTIVNMAQNFVGSNNINLLLPKGQFGSRLQGGKDSASARYIFTKLSPVARKLFPEVDDNLLEQNNDDGEFVEPTFYAPIIPMVLLNGSSGIGTGWSTAIPNHDVNDVLENVRRLVQGEEAQHMNPNYRNFRGSISKISEAQWITSGEIAALDEKTVEITELPIKCWTNNYRETVLDALRDGKEDKKTGTKTGGGLIADYKEYSTESRVRFVVTFPSEAAMKAAERSGIHKFFSCQSPITCTNTLVGFDDKGCLQKYKTALDIMKDWFNVRLQKYHDRKEYLEKKYKAECKDLENKARFIKEVCDDTLVIKRKSKDVLNKMLRDAGYDPNPIKAFQMSRLSVDKKRELEEKEAEEAAKKKDSDGESKSDYSYLLSMPMWSLTKERIDKLEAEVLKRQKELKKVKNTTVEQFWLTDLDEFEVELNKLLEEEKKEMDKEMPLKTGKKSKGRDMFSKKDKKPTKAETSLKKECLPDETAIRYDPKIDEKHFRVKKESGDKKKKETKKEKEDAKSAKGSSKLESFGFSKLKKEVEIVASQNEADQEEEALDKGKISEMLKKKPAKSALKVKSETKEKKLETLKPPQKKRKRNAWDTDSEDEKDEEPTEVSSGEESEFSERLPSRKVAKKTKTNPISSADEEDTIDVDSPPKPKKVVSKKSETKKVERKKPESKGTKKKNLDSSEEEDLPKQVKKPTKKSKVVALSSDSEEEVKSKSKSKQQNSDSSDNEVDEESVADSDSGDEMQMAKSPVASSRPGRGGRARKPVKYAVSQDSDAEEEESEEDNSDDEDVSFNMID